jgi:hypothetical protein
MAAAAALILMATPQSGRFLETVTSRALWAGLNHRLLPQDKWFHGMAWLLESAPGPRIETAPRTANPIATGSLPSQSRD